jgi:hypothetical protein
VDRLIRRFLALPLTPQKISRAPDERLVHVAAVLLTSQLTLAQSFNWELCYSPIQRILLHVYVRQGQGRKSSIRSLCDFPILGPGTVALRWAAKLVGDGILELAAAEEPSDRLIQLTSDGLAGLEHWLRCIDSGLMSDSRAAFSV